MHALIFRSFLGIATVLIGTQVWAVADASGTLAGRARDAADRAKPAALDVTVLRDPTCADCATFDAFLDALAKQQVTITQTRTLDAPSTEADALIAERGITRLPALVMTGEIGKHASVRTFLEHAGGAFAGDVFVANALSAPYVRLPSREVVGRMRLIRIVDGMCRACYDVGVHDAILRDYGVVPLSVETVDVATPAGRAFREQYRITAVPAFALVGDLDAYPALAQVWTAVGSREADSTAVFRKSGVEQMGAYRDLVTGKVVQPEPPPTKPKS